MYLPACLISQIGVYGVASRRQARMKGLARNPESAFADDPWAKPVSVPVVGSPDILELSRRSERSTGR